MGIAQSGVQGRWWGGEEKRGHVARQQLLFLQKLPAGGDVPFCGSSIALKFVGTPPQLGLTSSFGWSKERDPIKTRLCVGRGQGWRQTAPAQPALAQGDGSCKVKTVCWLLCACRKGDTLLQCKEMRSGEEGVMG